MSDKIPNDVHKLACAAANRAFDKTSSPMDAREAYAAIVAKKTEELCKSVKVPFVALDEMIQVPKEEWEKLYKLIDIGYARSACVLMEIIVKEQPGATDE